MHHKAYCHELTRVVSGEEVWNLLYSTRPALNNLTFKCSDETCSARLVLRNCYAHTLSHETRFRLYPREIHKVNYTYIKDLKAHKRTVSFRTWLPVPNYITNF